MKSIYDQIAALGQSLGADKIVLFGSRARGDYRDRSDIDIAVFGLSRRHQNAFIEGIEAIPTLLDFDTVFITDQTSPALLQNINKDGIILMNKIDDKLTKLQDAIARLQEALDKFTADNSDVVRDGAIQRFEFCTELAWKATREYLLDQGYTEINSPKRVMKKAYADGIISDEESWLSLLNDRNQTSHIYDDATAAAVFDRIRSTYVGLLAALAQHLAE